MKIAEDEKIAEEIRKKIRSDHCIECKAKVGSCTEDCKCKNKGNDCWCKCEKCVSNEFKLAQFKPDYFQRTPTSSGIANKDRYK